MATVRKPAAPAANSLGDVLQKFLEVKGVVSAIVVGNDGFVIESAGTERSSLVEMDALGASVATMASAVQIMGSELEVDAFEDLYIQFGRAVIVALTIGDAVLALVSPDASSLGIIRFNAKKLLPELEAFL